jgi:hypothetical protein
MPGTSALFIDVENYIRRTNEAAQNRRAPLVVAERRLYIDVKTELTYLQKLAFEKTAGRRLIVQRAYADFRVNILRGTPDVPGTSTADILMDLGIEPVQVYPYGAKNAADMRLIVDAGALMVTTNSVEQFIIAAGDADYIPLILDLRRRGAEVVVIAPEGSATKRLQYYCDEYLTLKNGRAEQGMDQGRMRSDFISYLAMLKEELPGIHLMPKSKWEAFRRRAFQCSANQHSFLLSELESLILESCPRGEVDLTRQEIRGGLMQMLESDCFLPAQAMAGSDQKVNWEKDKLKLDPEIGSCESLHQRVRDWLIAWYVAKGYDSRLVELAFEGGGLVLV